MPKFKDLDVVWLVASNVHPGEDFAECPDEPANPWLVLRNAVAGVDPIHLVTVHPSAGSTIQIFGDIFDIIYTQNQPCDNPTLETSARNNYQRPVINGEFNYEVTEQCWESKNLNTNCNQTGTFDCRISNFGGGCEGWTCCECDANCGQHHHSGHDVVLNAAWALEMRGANFVFGNAATYNQKVDTCFNSQYSEDGQMWYYRNSRGAQDMTKLFELFNSNPYFTINWENNGFEPKSAGNTNDKLALGETGKQYVLYWKNSSAGNFNINDPGNWQYYTYDIAHKTWSGPGTANNINAIPSAGNETVRIVQLVPVSISCESTTIWSPDKPSDVILCTYTPDDATISNLSCSVPNANFICSVGTASGGNFDLTITTSLTIADAGSYHIGVQATINGSPTSGSAFVQIMGTQCEGNWQSLPSNWYLSPNTQQKKWQVVNGQLQSDSNIKKMTAVPIPNESTQYFPVCDNCSVDTDVKINALGGKISLLGWYFYTSDKDSGKNRVEFMLDPNNNKAVLKQFINGTLSRKKAQKNLSFSAGTTYHLHINFHAGQFTATVVGGSINAVMQMAGVEPVGSQGFRTRYGLASFSEISVCYGCTATCDASCNCTTPIPNIPTNQGGGETIESGDQFSGTGEEPASNYSGNGTPHLTIQDLTVDEATGDIGYAVVEVQIAPAAAFAFTFDYSVSNISAIAPDDYSSQSYTLNVFAGEAVKVIRIPLIADYTIESNEACNVTISNASGGAVIDRSQATVTITDDDTPEDDEIGNDRFDISCPSQFSVIRGATRTMTCDITLYDPLNISTDIQWGCTNAPTGVSCTFQTVGNNQLLVSVVTSSNSPVGDSPAFTVSGTISEGVTSSAVNLHVVNFQPSCLNPITVTKGQYTDSTCSVGQSSNWTDSSIQVSWSCSGLPTGGTCIFTPNPWTITNGSTVNLRIQTTTNTPTGNYNITVTGTSGTQGRSYVTVLKVVTTYTFYPIGDSFLTGYEQQNSNNGLTTNLRIQHPPRFSHVVLKFSQSDIVNTIGTSQIVSASLKLYIETNFNNWGSGSNVNVHRMTAAWEEYISGSPAQGVTWNCSVDTNLGNSNPNCTTQWNGGSYDATILSGVLHQNNQTGWKIFDVTSDVQAIKSGSTHYGWLLRKPNTANSGSVDYTSIQGTAANKPRLEVTVQ